MSTTRFPIRLGARSRPLLRLFGVKGQEEAYVDLSATDLDARFGIGHASTPISNIASWRIEGPWLWITAIGIRRSIRHGDTTFGGSPHGGVRIDFKDPIKVVGLKTPALYVTVDDLEGLGAALSALGIAGKDARQGPR